MKKNYDNLRNWCNANQGLLTLIAIIIALIGLISFNKLDFGFANTLLDKIKVVIIYNVKIPVYLFLIILLIGLIYINKIRRKYKPQKISIEFLEGNWKNEWTINGQVGSEMCQIKKDGKYYFNGEHCFTLEDFKYDYKNDKITFIKSSVRSGDNRKMTNILTINNNDLISGTENDHEIRYKRL